MNSLDTIDDPFDFAVQCAAFLAQADPILGWVHRLPYDAALRPGGVWLRGIWLRRVAGGWEVSPREGGMTVTVRAAVPAKVPAGEVAA